MIQKVILSLWPRWTLKKQITNFILSWDLHQNDTERCPYEKSASPTNGIDSLKEIDSWTYIAKTQTTKVRG